jgi:tripartite-type tricarboxylate transporter receptor subunit TctC
MFVYLIKPCRHNVFINIDANEKGAIKLTFLLQMEDFNMSRFNTNWLRRTFIATLGTMLLGVFVMQTTEAKAEWPEKPIKMFVGFAAGGGTDTYARILSSLLHEELGGMPTVVINRPGAASMITLKHVAQQKADGYTLVMQAIGAAVGKELAGDSPVKFRKAMKPIGVLGVVPAILAVPIKSSFKTAKEFFDHAKANPGKLRWSHGGRGSYQQVALAKAFKDLGVSLKDVPFKGGAKAKAAVVAGQVDVGIMSIQNYAGFETKMRVLGVFNSKRDSSQKGLPTFKEQGLALNDIVSPFGVYIRAETPDSIVTKLRVAVKAVTLKKGYKRLIKKAGLKNGYLDPSQANALINTIFAQLSK